MYFSTSDGKEVWKMDSCSCCQMNTMGEHEWNCPLKSLPIAQEPLPPYDYTIPLCPSSWEPFPKTMKE